MSHIYVNQINFEFAESNTYHDILVNSGSGTPSIVEETTTPLHIYVNIVNLEIPVAAAITSEVVTNIGSGTQTILEEISGTPIPEPVAPGHGGYSSDTWMPVVTRRRLKEYVFNERVAEHSLDEQILVEETVEAVASAIPAIKATVRRPIFRKSRSIEVQTYVLAKDKSIIVPPETLETPLEEVITRQSRKDEEELLLLGII